MAKFIHLYESEAAFQAAYDGDDYLEPWVSYTESQTPHVDYNKRIRYVDLGLPSGALWAEYNLGASSSAETGDYYAWAELAPKQTYTTDTYKYWNDDGGYYTKYNDLNSRMLLPEDDVAYVTLGGNWQIPQDSDIQELLDNCTTSQGYDASTQTYYTELVSVNNGKKIRFVDTGYISGTAKLNDDYGYIWASCDVVDTSTTPNFQNVPVLRTFSEYGGADLTQVLRRYFGACIRPICIERGY